MTDSLKMSLSMSLNEELNSNFTARSELLVFSTQIKA